MIDPSVHFFKPPFQTLGLFQDIPVQINAKKSYCLVFGGTDNESAE